MKRRIHPQISQRTQIHSKGISTSAKSADVFRLLFVIAMWTFASVASAKETLVKNVAEFDAAVKDAKPGDEIVLTNGEWRDAELVFSGEGKESLRPDEIRHIIVRAETPGKVVLTGKSRLRIGGQFLAVTNLFWKSPEADDAVIQFRIDPKNLSQDCVLAGCAIIDDEPAKSDRKWVSLYGIRNAVRHCRFEGKRSAGTMLVVWLSDPPNEHQITGNFFGPRPELGKNGGETIRVGDSKTSMQESRTKVYGNYFYRCDGEAEIISNKSCRNTYFHNVFVGCGGALTLRHGNGCAVSENWFIGDHRKGTGGVRVIGEDHRIVGNHFVQLTGDNARAALCLMNGVPDSPLNGYFQVKRANIHNNSFYDCKESIVVGLADEDRDNQRLPPIGCRFTGNAVVSNERPVFFIRTAAIDSFDEGNAYIGKTLGRPSDDGWRQETPDELRYFADLPHKIANSLSRKRIVDDGEILVGPTWMRPGDEYLPEVLMKK